MAEGSTCPRCSYKFSVLETSHANNVRPFTCPNCGNKLHPVNLKSWVFGYTLGFISTGVPAKLYSYFEHNIVIALATGLVCGLTAIFIFAIYINKTTFFE